MVAKFLHESLTCNMVKLPNGKRTLKKKRVFKSASSQPKYVALLVVNDPRVVCHRLSGDDMESMLVQHHKSQTLETFKKTFDTLPKNKLDTWSKRAGIVDSSS